MSRLLSSALLVAVFAPVLLSAPVPVAPPEPLPKGASARLGSMAFRGPRIYSVQFSADGKKLHASSGWELLTWDAETGRQQPSKSFATPKKGSPDSLVAGNRFFVIEWEEIKQAAPGAYNPVGAVVVFDRETGKEISRLLCKGNVTFAQHYLTAKYQPSTTVSSDGRYAAFNSSTDKQIEVFDTTTGRLLHAQSCQAKNAGLLISTDNKTLYILDYGKPIRRHELVSGKKLPDLAGTDSGTDRVVISPDGKLLATRGKFHIPPTKEQAGGTGHDSFLRIHDATKNVELRKIEIGARPCDFEFVGSEAIVVITNKLTPLQSRSSTLGCWNVLTGKLEWEIDIPSVMSRLSISPDGKRIALIHSMQRIHTFDAATGKPIVEVVGHSGPIVWVGWSSDGSTVHTGCANSIISWTDNGKQIATAAPRELRDSYKPPLFGRHGSLVVTRGSGEKWELAAWDVENRDFAWRMPVGEKPPERLFTHDGKQVVGLRWDAVGKQWSATVYDGPAGKAVHEHTFKCGFQHGKTGPDYWPGLALSSDGKRLFVADADVQAINLATGKQELFSDVGPTQPDRSNLPIFTFSPDSSRFVTLVQARPGLRSGRLTVCEAKTGKRLSSYELKSLIATGVAFGPTGKQLAICSKTGQVMVYDTDTDEKPRLLTLPGHLPTCVAFSPNGASLAVGYQDGTALIWDLTAK